MAQVVRASLDRQRRLVADASHQLRNPLAAVRLRADRLDDCVAEAGRSTYRSMTAELDRLENLLQQLLRLARAEEVSGSRTLGLSAAVAESTDLADVIEERMAFWQPVADGQHQRLRYRSDESGLAVQLARHDVEQLLDVALDNALRYAGADTTVTVSTGRTGEMVDLVVSDDGSGLPDEDLSRAAARFWRGQDDRDGTGLGLAIAGEIAAGHGGAISVERAPEGGFLVRYRLPAASAHGDDRQAGLIVAHSSSRRRCWPPAACAANPDGSVRLAAGERGGLYRIRGAPRRTRSRPLIRTSASTWSRRRAGSTTLPACARGTSIWDWRWPTLPTGSRRRPCRYRTQAVARVYETICRWSCATPLPCTS